MKNKKLWSSDTPGRWLTHSLPEGGVDEPMVSLPSEGNPRAAARVPKSLDDVFSRM